MNEEEVQKIVDETLSRLRLNVDIDYGGGNYSGPKLKISLVLCSKIPFEEWKEITTNHVRLSSLKD